MNTQYTGYALLTISVLMLLVLVGLFTSYQQEAERLGCYEESDMCEVIDQQLNVTHLFTGIVGFLLALGVYLSFFHVAERAIVKKLDENEERLSDDERFDIISHMLGDADTKILRTIKLHKEIKQNRLQQVTGYSKAKISEATSFLEDKHLISKERAGRTNLLKYKGPKTPREKEENKKQATKE